MAQVDDLILQLIDSGRLASAGELDAIVAHVAQAPFATYMAKVPNQLRQLFNKQELPLPTKLSSLEIHLLKRIEEGQWPRGTTPGQYVSDLQQAVGHPYVQIWVYRYYEQPFAGFLSPSHIKNTEGSRAYIFAVYSPIHSTITTGYQASSSGTIFTDGYTALKRQR